MDTDAGKGMDMAAGKTGALVAYVNKTVERILALSQEHEQNPEVASAATHARFNQGIALHQQGKLADAARLYREVLRHHPNHFGALHLLGVIAIQTRQPEQGADLIRRAIGLDANVAAAHSNLGTALLNLKRAEEALVSCDTAITLKPDFALAHNNRANALLDLKRAEEALASCDKAIALKSDFAQAHYSRANALNALKRFEEALASYDKAIALKPDFAEAYYNRGKALTNLRRFDTALADYDKALALKFDFVEAHNNRGLALHALKHHKKALASYDKAIALRPDFAEAYNNRGLALNDLMRHEEALASYNKAITLKSDFAEAYNNRGLALNDLKRHEEALASYDKALALKPDFAEAYNNRGVVLTDLKRHEDALASYNKAIELKPDFEFLYGSLVHTKMTICDWSNFIGEKTFLEAKIKRGEKVSLPFPFLSISNCFELQQQASAIWTRAKCPKNNTLPTLAKRPRRDKIHLGYFSADFHDHATSQLMAELFERHDRSRFQVIAFSYGPDIKDKMRQRLGAAFDKFIDVRDKSDIEVAILARELEIDIAVDLKGFTADGRTSIFAFSAAPIQVSYLGYPGTLAASFIDYLIADSILIPESQKGFYTEKIAYLPNSYQVNSKRLISTKTFTRADVGLPEDVFVFCCFNNNYKITPDIFDRWMRILKQVEGAVLWLLEDNASVVTNLRQEAAARGINPDRLALAKRIPLPDHLARHRLADLFLDTLPYNAHTTASDALWAGLPVLTQIGETFAGRVAASLLNAIGLPELITSTPDSYGDVAIELATNPDKLAVIKHKLAMNRLTAPLFDIRLFTEHFEAAYSAMYDRYHADLPPDHIYVPQ